MNIYDRIYRIVIESTPAGREGSRAIGRGFAREIASTRELLRGTPGTKPVPADEVERILVPTKAKAKKRGRDILSRGQRRTRLGIRTRGDEWRQDRIRR